MYMYNASIMHTHMHINMQALTYTQDMSQTAIHALVGSVADESTITLSTISKRHEMPIWGYNAKSGVLADKVLA